MSLSCFSQIGINKPDTNHIVLKPIVARLVIKDLIRGDGCSEELQLTQNKIFKLQQREAQKDSIISLLKIKDDNNQQIISIKDQQLRISTELSNKLEKEAKANRRETIIYKIGTAIGLVATTFLLISK